MPTTTKPPFSSLAPAPREHNPLPLLGVRLDALRRWIQPTWRVADIGTDHGLLPLHLLAQGHTQTVIACDKNPGPIASVKENHQLYLPDAPLQIRRGDGLAPLQDGEVDAVILAGMGRNTIERILRSRDLHRMGLRYLLIQSNTQEELLRRALLQRGWRLLDEFLVEDQCLFYVGHLVEITNDPPLPQPLPPESWLCSPYLLQHPPALLARFFAHKSAWLDKQCAIAPVDPPPEQGGIPPHAYRNTIRTILATHDMAHNDHPHSP